VTITARRPRQRPLGPSDSRNPVQRRQHGLTPAERVHLSRVQGGACAICGRTGIPLHVDHDHRHCPGKEGCRRCVRGLLCNRCNSALGWIGDLHVPALIRYLGR
jgi:hypothetical protein